MNRNKLNPVQIVQKLAVEVPGVSFVASTKTQGSEIFELTIAPKHLPWNQIQATHKRDEVVRALDLMGVTVNIHAEEGGFWIRVHMEPMIAVL